MKYALLLITLGCSPNFGAKFENNTGNDLDSNQEDDLLPSSGLPSLVGNMVTDFCDDEQPNVAGATSYFLGTYVRENDGWIGREQWILHPTPSWTATNNETCYITWETTAEETDLGGCSSCDFALKVNANINRQQTDCPEGLWDGEVEGAVDERQWTEDYDIKIEDNAAVFYFQGSGDLIGNGYANNTAVNFLSNPTCVWF